jgi:hypothetical protein
MRGEFYLHIRVYTLQGTVTPVQQTKLVVSAYVCRYFCFYLPLTDKCTLTSRDLLVISKTVSGLDYWIYGHLIHKILDYRQYNSIAD